MFCELLSLLQLIDQLLYCKQLNHVIIMYCTQAMYRMKTMIKHRPVVIFFLLFSYHDKTIQKA